MCLAVLYSEPKQHTTEKVVILSKYVVIDTISQFMLIKKVNSSKISNLGQD